MIGNRRQRDLTTIGYGGEQIDHQVGQIIQRFYSICIREVVGEYGCWTIPLPMTHNLMRPAQYSFLHHSTSRRRVSRLMGPPSSPGSRLEAGVKLMEDDGEGRDEDAGENPLSSTLAVPFTRLFLRPVPIKFRAASVRLRLFPLPNLLHTWPGFVRCLLT